MKKIISLLGVPMWLGQPRYGVNLGPDAIHTAGIVKHLEALNLRVIDEGNIKVEHPTKIRPSEKRYRRIAPIVKTCERVAAKVSSIIEQKHFPLIMGGDHSISIGTLAGIAKYYNNLGVIWYDAHADINTPETTPSGNIHGMPLAASMGLGHSDLTRIGGYQGKVRPENIVFIGIRDIDEGEQQLIDQKGIRVYTVDDVKSLGIERVIDETIEYLSSRCDGIHLSFDLDGIDPKDIPAVGTPVANGISYTDSLIVMEKLWQSGVVTSAEIVEYNPLFDNSDKTARAAVTLAATLFGGKSNESSCRTDQVNAKIKSHLA